MIPSDILQKVHRIEIRTKSILNTILSGEYHSVFRGQGMEFSEVRSYVEGDDIRSIDWNVTARIGEPYVKKYMEERELTVMLVVDASASGNFASVNKFKNELAAELCAVLAFSALKNNDRVGLIMFTDQIETFVPPKKGKNHVLRVIRELLCFTPQHKGTNIGAALQFLNKVQKKKAVAFLVSDFLASGYEKPLQASARRHDVIALSLVDPSEKSLPSVGLVDLYDSEAGEYCLVDTSDKRVQQEFTRQYESRTASRSSLFKSNGVDEIHISTHEDFIAPIVTFFKMRERKLRR